MSRIVRWDPFRDMAIMQTQLDRVMDEWMRASRVWSNGDTSNPFHVALDVSETEGEFVVKASIPGINPDDIDISFVDNTLTIRGETKEEHVDENEHFHLRERRMGQFSRTVTLPLSVKADEIDAQYENGVLTLTLPKAEELKPKKISVRSQNNKVLEG